MIMETFSFFMILFAIVWVLICTIFIPTESRTESTVSKVVTVIAYVLAVVFLCTFVIRAVFQHSMYKNAVITEATLIQKDLEVKWSNYFIYEYIVDTTHYRGEDFCRRRVTSDLEIGDSFYIFYDSTRPWMATYLEKNERLLTDPSWANRQFVLKRKETMLWWRD